MTDIGCTTEGCMFLGGHEAPCSNETENRPRVVQATAILDRTSEFDIDSAMLHLRRSLDNVFDAKANTITFQLPDGDVSAEFRRVVTDILPGVLSKYHTKSVDYAGTKRDLGPRGQFSDMWRKLKKLKKALWDGQTLVGEQPDEIIDDLIAHCLLIKLDMHDGIE